MTSEPIEKIKIGRENEVGKKRIVHGMRGISRKSIYEIIVYLSCMESFKSSFFE
uniref:Uncharacterized protein n=1 Tax=Pithovirus LCPAC403 TaxID=2506596 RepID=A0A481ZCF1_9VIRU|nr:MAG: hypothetical protein LCPAC403_01460 [Pithovirus LCPAC403]